jgi:hypothetical protein
LKIFYEFSIKKGLGKKVNGEYHVFAPFGNDFTYIDAERSLDYLKDLVLALNSSSKSLFGV